MIALSALVYFIVYVLIVAVIAYFLVLGVDYLVGYLELPGIIAKLLKVIIVIVAILIVLNMIIPFIGTAPVQPLIIK